MNYIGDFLENSEVIHDFSTNDRDGESISPSVDGTIYVYKGNTTNRTTTGVTTSMDHDGIIGNHVVTLDTTDAFYTTNNDYRIVIVGIIIDGQTINATIGRFSIENRSFNISLWTETIIAEIRALELEIDDSVLDEAIRNGLSGIVIQPEKTVIGPCERDITTPRYGRPQSC